MCKVLGLAGAGDHEKWIGTGHQGTFSARGLRRRSSAAPTEALTRLSLTQGWVEDNEKFADLSVDFAGCGNPRISTPMSVCLSPKEGMPLGLSRHGVTLGLRLSFGRRSHGAGS